MWSFPSRSSSLRAVVAASVAASGTPAAAQGAPEIVVTGASLPQPAGAAAYGSVTLGREAISAEPSGRLEALLRDVAGFQLFRRTDARAANPTSQGASLRALGGNASSRALVLLDGVPQLDPFAGWVPWPALDPDRLQAVRVTRGGGAGAFGSGALAGTIEMFSAGLAELATVDASAEYGSRDSMRAGAGLAAPLSGGFATLSGRYDRGDGYVLLSARQRGRIDAATPYEQWGVAGRAVLPVGAATELQVRGVAFADDRSRGLPGADSANEGTDASVRLVGRGRWAWEALAYVQARRFESGFASVDATRTAATPTLDQFNTPATGLGAKVELRPPVGGGHDVQVGVDVRRNVGRTRERFRFQAGEFTRLREAGGATDVVGVYVEDGWRLSDAVTLTGGVRLDRWSIRNGFLSEREIGSGAGVTALDFADRSGWEPTARGGAVLAATPAIGLRAATYTGFRVPTLNELYRPFRVGADATAANPDLDTERLRGVEAGVDFAPIAALDVGATLFWNEVERAIANVTLGRGPGTFPQVGFVGGAFRQRLNVDAVRSRGVEASARLGIGAWALSGSYAFTDARISAEGAAAELDGRRPAQTPRHQASASLRYARGGASAAVIARYAGSQFEDDLEVRRLDAALTIDGSAEVALGRGVALTAAVENLFDEEVQAGITEAGIVDRAQPRTLWVGLRFAAR